MIEIPVKTNKENAIVSTQFGKAVQKRIRE